MISRIYIKCLTCSDSITLRVQIGHELEQSHTIQCPHCSTDIRFKLILDNPPNVKAVWEENCEEMDDNKGKIVNVGVGFTINKDMLHDDYYFPAFTEVFRRQMLSGGLVVGVGGVSHAVERWKIIQKALRFHFNGQELLKSQQLSKFLEADGTKQQNTTIDEALFLLLSANLGSVADSILKPLSTELDKAKTINASEFFRFAEHYNNDLKKSRFESYVEVFSEFFKGYGEFNQTLMYVRLGHELDETALATSSAFDTSKMFYGNAFEVLGTHLDMLAAINNIVCGRPFDQMLAMNMKLYRTIDKAKRLNCFADNPVFAKFISEYDSTIRNASHHRSFKISNNHQKIQYRSGGTGALHEMSYAQYLYKCNKMAFQLIGLACLELIFLMRAGKSL